MFNAGFTAPVFAPCPNVTVFYDLRHRLQPEGFRWFDRPFWRFLLWTSARVSKRIITISESARTDFTAIYGVPAERITVVYPGLEPRFFELQRDHTEPFVLCVSALFPHKNHARLIRAFARRQRDFRLVLAGMRNFQAPMLDALIAELGVADSVQLTGWIPREEIFGLYQRAHAFIYPSTFEGFGMPVLEAMAAGIPVACSDIPSLREAAEDAVLRFDPLSEDAIAEALDRITTDKTLRNRLVVEGPERARMFTWNRAATATLRALSAVSGVVSPLGTDVEQN